MLCNIMIYIYECIYVLCIRPDLSSSTIVLLYSFITPNKIYRKININVELDECLNVFAFLRLYVLYRLLYVFFLCSTFLQWIGFVAKEEGIEQSRYMNKKKSQTTMSVKRKYRNHLLQPQKETLKIFSNYSLHAMFECYVQLHSYSTKMSDSSSLRNVKCRYKI